MDSFRFHKLLQLLLDLSSFTFQIFQILHVVWMFLLESTENVFSLFLEYLKCLILLHMLHIHLSMKIHNGDKVDLDEEGFDLFEKRSSSSFLVDRQPLNEVFTDSCLLLVLNWRQVVQIGINGVINDTCDFIESNFFILLKEGLLSMTVFVGANISTNLSIPEPLDISS